MLASYNLFHTSTSVGSSFPAIKYLFSKNKYSLHKIDQNKSLDGGRDGEHEEKI